MSDIKTHKKDTVEKSDQTMQGDKIGEGNSSCSTDNALIANQSQDCMMLKPSRIFQATSATPDLEKVDTAIILPTNNLLKSLDQMNTVLCSIFNAIIFSITIA